MSKLHIGPHTHRDEPDPHPAHAPVPTFDREISLRGVFYTVAGLVAVAVVVHLLIWGLIKGFSSYDTRRDPAPSPLPQANVQPPPPGPQLQTTPEIDLLKLRQIEDQQLGRSGWIDQQQGTVHVPIDVAMEVIAGRGLGPEVVGGTPGGFPAAAPTPTPQPQAARTPPAPERR